MRSRRIVALAGPVVAAGALLLPWYVSGDLAVRGWNTLTYMNWYVLAISLALTLLALRGPTSIARAACVAGGGAYVFLGLRSLVGVWSSATLPAGWWLERPGVGPWVLLAAGLATIAAGRALHVRPGDVATARRLAVLLGAAGTTGTLSLTWWNYPDAFVGGDSWAASGWDTLATQNWFVGLCPVVTLVAAVGTALAAYLLYAPRRVASSAITAS